MQVNTRPFLPCSLASLIAHWISCPASPFHFGLAEQAIALLEEKNWLLPRALIYVETEKDKPLSVPDNWQLLKEKTTGMVSYRLYQKD